MTKRFAELTIAYEDDPALNPNNVVEVFHRTKEDEGAWSAPSDIQNCALRSSFVTSWAELEIKKV